MSGNLGANLINQLQNTPMAQPGYWGQQMQNMNALQDYNAKQAWGQALQQATDPTTGTVDYGKAQAIAARNPNAAFGMATNLQNTSNIRSQQIDQTSGLYNLVGRMSASLMKDPSDANVAAIRAQAVNAGLPPGALTEIDRIAALPVDQRATEAYNHNVGALDALGRIHQTVGQTTLQNVGGTLAPVTLDQPTPTASGSATVGAGSIPITMTPDQLAAPHSYVDANGVTQNTTVGEYLKTLGLPIPTGGQQVGASTGSVPSPSASVPPPPSGTSVRPRPSSAPSQPPPQSPGAPASKATANQPASVQPPAQPSVATAPPGVTVSPTGGRSIPGATPGQAEALQDTAKQSAAMGTALTARADQVPTNKANYANMLTDLSRIGNMPPGGEREIAINTFLQKATGYGITMTPDQIAAGNSFAKLANIAVGQQLQAIGGTDARQALFMGSNPNLDLSKLGNTQIIHMLQGNEDAIQAKSRAWQAWQKGGNGPGTYAQFQDDFNHHFDPRVFQQQYMQGPEIASLRKSLAAEGPGATQKFLDDVKYARGQQWIQ